MDCWLLTSVFLHLHGLGGGGVLLRNSSHILNGLFWYLVQNEWAGSLIQGIQNTTQNIFLKTLKSFFENRKYIESLRVCVWNGNSLKSWISLCLKFCIGGARPPNFSFTLRRILKTIGAKKNIDLERSFAVFRKPWGISLSRSRVLCCWLTYI